MRAGPEHEVTASQVNELGDPQSGLDGEQYQRAIPAAYPRGDVGCREQRVGFGPCQVGDRPSLVPFDGDRQNPAAAIEMRRLADGHVVTEGVNRGEADIPRPRRVAPVLLDMIEKRADERGIQIVGREGRGRLAEPLLCKPEQQPKRIAIGRNGMGARPLLADEPCRSVAADWQGTARPSWLTRLSGIGQAPSPAAGAQGPLPDTSTCHGHARGRDTSRAPAGVDRPGRRHDSR